MSLFSKALIFTLIALSNQSNALQIVENSENVNKHPNAAHLIYINYDGNLLHPNGRQSIPRETEYAYIKNINQNFNRLNKLRPLKLVIFIHGGLNPMKGANERPDKFRDIMLAEGYYPIFISWNSGPWTNYSDHLFKVRKGNVAVGKAVISSPLYFLEDLTRSILKAPAAYSREMRKTSSLERLQSDELQQAYPFLVKELQLSGFKLYNTEILPSSDNSFDPLFPFKLISKGITAPIIDGLGKGAWNSMLRRTDLVFTRPYSENDLLTEKIISARENKTYVTQNFNTAASKFFTLWMEMEENSNVEVIVIGHSMGTLVANQIVTRYPKLNIKKLVYMGAAAPMRDVENIISPWLYADSDRSFYNLSLDPHNEIGEKITLDFAPKGSLLNWIDNIFADIYSIKDRTSGSWGNMLMLADDVFLPNKELRQRVHLTKFHVKHHKDDDIGPQNHGDFAKYAFWREEYWTGETTERILK